MLDTLKAEVKSALLGGDRFRVETLKMAQAALLNARIAKTADLTDEECIAVIQKEIKKRRDAATMYAGAGSPERAETEVKEISILEQFVPKLLSGADLAKAVDELLSPFSPAPSFSDAMKMAITALPNADKSQLAGLLKTKLG